VLVGFPGRDVGLSPAVEAALRWSFPSARVFFVADEGELCRLPVPPATALLVADADGLGPERLQGLVASLRSDPGTRWLPVLVLAGRSSLADPRSLLGSAYVEFVLVPPLDPPELEVRVCLVAQRAAALAKFERVNAELARQAMSDGLTGLYNTVAIVERCKQEVARARRYGRPVSCVLIDIDGFKAVNDTHGHSAGNVVLGEFARLLRSSVRASDIVGRYGGEEFLLVLPETGLGGAVAAAERLRRAVEETVFRAGTEEIRLTISVGVASLPARHAPGGEEGELLAIVDRAVYRAKALGRNRVAWLESEPVVKGDEPVG